MYSDLNMNRTLINAFRSTVNALCAADSGLLKQRFREKSSLQVTSCIALGNLFQNPAPAANPGSSDGGLLSFYPASHEQKSKRYLKVHYLSNL